MGRGIEGPRTCLSRGALPGTADWAALVRAGALGVGVAFGGDDPRAHEQRPAAPAQLHCNSENGGREAWAEPPGPTAAQPGTESPARFGLPQRPWARAEPGSVRGLNGAGAPARIPPPCTDTDAPHSLVGGLERGPPARAGALAVSPGAGSTLPCTGGAQARPQLRRQHFSLAGQSLSLEHGETHSSAWPSPARAGQTPGLTGQTQRDSSRAGWGGEHPRGPCPPRGPLRPTQPRAASGPTGTSGPIQPCLALLWLPAPQGQQPASESSSGGVKPQPPGLSAPSSLLIPTPLVQSLDSGKTG